MLAQRLCEAAGGRVTKAFFCSSGSEGVEAAIKFSRASCAAQDFCTQRALSTGLTCGALSLMGDAFWRDRFGPMLPDTAACRSEISTRLNRHLLHQASSPPSLIEPIQGEAGIRLPHADYLREAQDLCRRHGTLFVLDEVQTGHVPDGPFSCEPPLRSRPGHGGSGQGAERRSGALQRGADDRCHLRIAFTIR